MRKRLFILLLCFVSIAAGAQTLRASDYGARTAWYFNVGDLYKYNLYERSRIEANFTCVTPSENAPASQHSHGQWTFNAYGGFGTLDHEFKYGGSAQFRVKSAWDIKLRLQAFKDLEQAARRRMEDYALLNPAANHSYLASRFSSVIKVAGSLEASPAPGLTATVRAQHSWEELRFDSQGLIYPIENPDIALPQAQFSEICANIRWKQWTLDAKGGLMADGSRQALFARAILQFNAPIFVDGMKLFAQAGYSTDKTPYSRMFDLSGSASSYYYFNNSFLTVRPNTFTANTFVHVCLNYATPKPLWNLLLSSPRLFAQVNALWGSVAGGDSDGKGWRPLYGSDTAPMPVAAPTKGIIEPAIGIDGLLRWGVLDLGFAVSYQIAPSGAIYRNTELFHNWGLAGVARLIIDER